MEVRKYNRRGDLCIVILVMLLFLFFIPRLMGLEVFSMVSGRMEPVISTGSIIFAKHVDIKELKNNDVISFYGNHGRIVTHRIMSIDDDGIVTKGDANSDVDMMKVRDSQFIGKVLFSIPLLGYLSQYVYIIAIILCFALFIFWYKAYRIEKRL